jgi:hypothetical protein
MGQKFCHHSGFISGVCGTFIDALYEIAVPYLTNPAIFYD